MFDYNAVRETYLGDIELVKEVLVYFLEQIPQYTKGLKEAWENRDTEQLVFFCHTIKGEAKNLAAEEVAVIAETLEFSFRNENFSNGEADIKKLEEAFEVLISEIKPYCV